MSSVGLLSVLKTNHKSTYDNTKTLSKLQAFGLEKFIKIVQIFTLARDCLEKRFVFVWLVVG